MDFRQITDKEQIESRLRQQAPIHLYEIGDLDDFFWPCTTWFCREADGTSDEIALLYRGGETPVLLAFTKQNGRELSDLLKTLGSELPDVFHAHLSEGRVRALESQFRFESFGLHLKMELTRRDLLRQADTSETVSLRPCNLDEILELYARAYPNTWFDSRMLETSMYFGIRRNSRLVAISGVHVYSERYRVAALGNITTDPALRRQGLATSVTARLCLELAQTCDHIGLNVKADNRAALVCYEKLGFVRTIAYDEGRFTRWTGTRPA